MKFRGDNQFRLTKEEMAAIGERIERPGVKKSTPLNTPDPLMQEFLNDLIQDPPYDPYSEPEVQFNQIQTIPAIRAPVNPPVHREKTNIMKRIWQATKRFLTA